MVLMQVHIQNATLAGGVAIGSAANMMVGPGGALAVGITAGEIQIHDLLGKSLLAEVAVALLHSGADAVEGLDR